MKSIVDEIGAAPGTGLTERMERYCQLAAVTSYAEAYRTAYNPGVGYNYHEDIRRLNRDPRIIRRITELQAKAAEPIAATREWLLRWWFYRMVYDPAELTAWVSGACRYCHGDGFEYQWREHEYLRAIDEATQDGAPLPDIAGGFGYNATKTPHPDCPSCDGRGIARTNITDTSALSPQARAAFEGIKETKQGLEIKMADKAQAAENFAKLSGFDVVQVRHMVDQLPEDAALADMARDPLAAAAAYKRLMGVAVH